jgi:hypothetical protein
MADCVSVEVRVLQAIAERLDALADTAELMGDLSGEARWREQAAGRRMQALACWTTDDHPVVTESQPVSEVPRSAAVGVLGLC